MMMEIPGNLRQNTVESPFPPGVDPQKVFELYDGDCNIYLPVLRAYADEIPETLNRLRNVSAAALPDYARVMHGIKGTSASVCAEEARKMAASLEAAAKSGDITGVLAQNDSFLQYMDKFVTGIQNWLRRNGV
ncbi:MAG TPA: hypothetical protein DEQ14_04700 [Treponema sp.]|nr:hypothetical protein [Treponema sp.]